jgi:hypothetical protein
MFEGTDNSDGDEQVSQTVDTSTDDVEVDTEALEVDTDTTAQTDATQAVNPFATGKEKFKVDGEEHEWTWEETRKYAQLGKMGYKRSQEAAALKKQVADNYKKLTQMATTNPQALIEILTGRKQSPSQQGQGEEQTRQSEERGFDHRDAELQELKQRVEARELADERKAIENELSDSVSKYPELNNEIYREYVKSQYTKALRRGEDVAIEDIAFMVSQSIKEQQSKDLRTKQQKLKERRDRAPSTVPPGFKSEKSDDMDLDAVKRLAGRM